MNFQAVKEDILYRLEQELTPYMYFHNIQHTLDVINAVTVLGLREKYVGDDLTLLKTAALFHDLGYIFGYEEHETRGCSVLQEVLPKYNYSTSEIGQICKLVMATRFPHKPKSHMEMVICDADMDHLGRDDYFLTAEKLYKELVAHNRVETRDEWNRLQVEFLTKHAFFTETARNLRENKKQQHLELIKKRRVSA